MFFVISIDAATWTVIRPNLDKLPTFKKLCEIAKCKELIVREKLISASMWCGMFCGKTPDEHGHESYVVEGNIVKREGIKVDFIWDILHKEGKRVKVLNVPFVIPAYSFNVDFRAVSFGLPTNEKEWQEKLERVTEKTKELLGEKPDLLVSVYTPLDRIQHSHWGEDCVLEWYRKLEGRISELLFDTGFFQEKQNKLVVISDHGFCSFGEAKVQTLPQETKEGKLRGDHYESALLIPVNIGYEINKPQDVFYAIKEEVR